jgi:hypothetical protein
MKANPNLLYAILDADSIQGLEENVHDMIEEDWVPLGGVAVSNAFFHQAMVKDDTIAAEISLAFKAKELAKELSEQRAKESGPVDQSAQDADR